MGQKVNPHGLRVGIVKDWDAKWYADKDFAANLHEDVKIRNFLKETLFIAGISRIEIERTNKRIKLTIHTAKPGMVIGRGGAGIEDIKKAMTRFTDKQVDVNIAEIKQADMDATLVAENIAGQFGTPYRLPSCNETSCRSYNALRCKRYQNHGKRSSWRR